MYRNTKFTEYEIAKWDEKIFALQREIDQLRRNFRGAKDRMSVVICGYALAWHTINQNRTDGKRLLVRRGQLDVADDAAVHCEHKGAIVLASRSVGSARFIDDDLGLICAFMPAKTGTNERVVAELIAKPHCGMSIGAKYTPSRRPPRADIRTVYSGTIHEISVVERPSFAATCLRVLDDQSEAIGDDEALENEAALIEMQRDCHWGNDDIKWSEAGIRMAAKIAKLRCELRLASLS